MNINSDKLLEAHIEDMFRRCDRDFIPVYSSFLDERQCAEALRVCNRHNELLYKLWGGFDNAQRKILCIYNEYNIDNFLNDFPARCLTFSYKKEYKLSHRDFLGSFMALRLKREAVGDIIIDDGIAQTFITEVAAKLVLENITKIGKVGVKISDDLPFNLEVKPEFEEISGTVASLRLDCIVSTATRLSREGAARLIRSEKISVNHFPAISVSNELNEGDIITVRGYGKFVLSNVNGTTKKGRIHINLRKYK